MHFNRFSFLKIALIFISSHSFASDVEVAKEATTKNGIVSCPLNPDNSGLQIDFNSCEPNIFETCGIKAPNELYIKRALDDKFTQMEDKLLSTMIAAYEKENNLILKSDKQDAAETDDDYKFNPSDYHIPKPEDGLPEALRQKYNEARDELMEKFIQDFVSKNFWYDYFPVKGSEYSYTFFGSSNDQKIGQPLFIAADTSINFRVDCKPNVEDYKN